MTDINITKGHDINLAGAPEKVVIKCSCPKIVKIIPTHFVGVKPKLLVKEMDSIKIGSKLFFDKNNPDMHICSPVAGRVEEIKLGDRRKVLEIVLSCTNNEQEFTKPDINLESATAIDIKSILLDTGLWPSIRQRPFSRIAKQSDIPKSIFVSGMPNAPFSLDQNYILNDTKNCLKEGFKVLNKLTSGNINLVLDRNKEYSFFDDIEDVKIHRFTGPYPSGNVGIHIHHIDPIRDRNDIVWYISLQDLNDIGNFFKNGIYPTEKRISVGGSCLSKPAYYKIKKGMIVSDILNSQHTDTDNLVISGDVLGGIKISMDSPLDFYHEILAVIPYTKQRDFLGWILPGLNKYSLSRTFLSALFSKVETNPDSRINGSRRAIIPFGRWERVLPMDIIPDFLIKSILARDVEDMEKYGIYECDHEDFALCAYVCQSKIEVSKIIKEGLEFMEQEG